MSQNADTRIRGGHDPAAISSRGVTNIMDHWLTSFDCTDDQKPKKRGRPPKSKESPTATTQQAAQNSPDQLRTPQIQTQGLPQDANITPTQVTPPKSTPTKSAVVKALPTVRDHTTDQLTTEQDEYLPREYDEAGETKVSPTGEPLGGRQFKMRTFYVAHRGNKKFMLATECARVLGYRDSYLLFNKNRSLHKIIATQAEKDELIHQEILPYSYRSRQIAIVTAKSMFRQFGARVIEGGRRVRDDYWEAKAKKQGFTEEDMAGDKRPGATKAREATAALEASNNPLNQLAFGQQQDIIYAATPMNAPDHPHPQGPGYPGNPGKVEDSRQQAYGAIPRPRQEMPGVPYMDRTQPASPADIMHQAHNAAELNKQIAQQRKTRAKYLEDTWNKDLKTPVSTPPQKVEQSPLVTQSPHLPSSSAMNPSQQSMLQQHSQLMSPQAAYARQPQPHHQNPHAQSPSRASMSSSIRPDLQHQQRSSISYTPSQQGPQTSPYGYPQPNQMWGHPPPQPQQSPLSSHHPQYSPSPHPQQHHPPSQSPHTQHPQQPPQLHHSQSSGSLHSNLNYQTMAGMPTGPAGYSQAATIANVRAMYPPQQSSSPSHAQSQYIQQQQATTAAQQVGMPGWAPRGPPPQQQQAQGGGWQQGGYPSSSGY